jgi:hypothetical protein
MKILFLFIFFSLQTQAQVKMEDLGVFSSSVPEGQMTDSILEMRENKLHHHKKMGHITMGLMTASFLTAVLAKHDIDDARSSRGGLRSKDDASKLNLHMGLSLATLASYYTTAYFSLSAPKSDAYQDESARSWHKGLAWIHGPAMILAPILGALAFKDHHDGEEVGGLGKLHKPVMMAGFAAFLASYSIAVYSW